MLDLRALALWPGTFIGASNAALPCGYDYLIVSRPADTALAMFILLLFVAPSYCRPEGPPSSSCSPFPQ